MEKSEFGMNLRFAGVSMVPGRTTLAVIPAAFVSNASVRTRDTNAAFDAEYAASVGWGSTAVRLPIATIAPFFFACMPGNTA